MGWWKSAVGPSSVCLAQKIMKNDVSYMGVKKLLVLGGWRVGWRKPAAGPSPLQQAQKIVKNDVSYMGGKKC